MPIPWLVILRSKWLYIGLLVAALGVQTLRVGHYRAKAEACATARENDRRAYAAAAKEAEAKALAQKQAVEAAYRAKSEETDRDYQTALARAQRAADAYARRMRAPAIGSTGGSAAPAPSDGPESPDRSGGDAVVLSRHDFDVMVDNSIRLKAAHDWAKTLSLDDVAPAFGGEAHSPTVAP